MDKAYLLSSLNIIWSLDVKKKKIKKSFRPHEDEKKVIDLEVPYLSLSKRLIYLARYI